jgi:hypothetical protein
MGGQIQRLAELQIQIQKCIELICIGGGGVDEHWKYSP